MIVLLCYPPRYAWWQQLFVLSLHKNHFASHTHTPRSATHKTFNRIQCDTNRTHSSTLHKLNIKFMLNFAWLLLSCLLTFIAFCRKLNIKWHVLWARLQCFVYDLPTISSRLISAIISQQHCHFWLVDTSQIWRIFQFVLVKQGCWRASDKRHELRANNARGRNDVAL